MREAKPKHPRYHTRSTGAQVVAMYDAGMREKRIAELLGLRNTTVADIVHGRKGWHDIRDDDFFKEMIATFKKQIQAQAMHIMNKCMRQIDNEIDNASARDAAVIFGITFDKARVAGNEPTEIVDHRHMENVNILVNLSDKLLQEKQKRQERDVTNANGREEETDGGPAPGSP